MAVIAPSSFAQSYAQSFVIKTLRSINIGRLVFILRYNNNEKITCGSTDAATGPEAVIFVNNPRFWTRLLIAFDLVCFKSLSICVFLTITVGIFRSVHVAGHRLRRPRSRV
jgi:hypothetical protein